MGEVGLLLSATPLMVVVAGVGVVLPLQVADLRTSSMASSTSFFDILRGREELRVANSCGPGTGGGIKEDPGEGKG